LASTDFFVVPTVTFRVLFVFIVLVHPRRRVIHFNVTAHPSSEWTARQIAEPKVWAPPAGSFSWCIRILGIDRGDGDLELGPTLLASKGSCNADHRLASRPSGIDLQ